jgi:cytochrome c oxidase assembly protein subunit 11
MNRPEGRQANRQMLLRLLVVVPLMFAFGYALVPLYKKICDVTGINFLTKKRAGRATQDGTKVDLGRIITIQFDANVHGSNHLSFKPLQSSIRVHPGAVEQVMYEIVNTRAQAVTMQAIPSYAPIESGQYFDKLECFCFRQQVLQPNETRQMPVVFAISPEVPKHIDTITLSYTSFEIGPKQ